MNNGTGYPAMVSTRRGVGYSMPGVMVDNDSFDHQGGAGYAAPVQGGNGNGLGQSQMLAQQAQQVFSAAQELAKMRQPAPQNGMANGNGNGGMNALLFKWGLPALVGLGAGYWLWRK